MERTIKCKHCDSTISVEYDKVEGKNKIYLADITQDKTKTCTKAIFLTCENYHTDKYYCRIVIGR